jgi:hypothetical protein
MDARPYWSLSQQGHATGVTYQDKGLYRLQGWRALGPAHQTLQAEAPFAPRKPQEGSLGEAVQQQAATDGQVEWR